MEEPKVYLFDCLKDIFNLINSWLAFAEAKNGIILSIFCGLLYTFHSQINEYNIVLSCTIYFLFFLGIFISLTSFYPNLTKSDLKEINSIFLKIANFKIWHRETTDNQEIPIKLFYLDIADNYVMNDKPNYQQYLLDLSRDYVDSSNINVNFSQLEKDYAQEIIINAKIVTNKYKLFNASLKVLIIIITLLFGMTIYKNVTEEKYFLTISDSVIIREFPSSQAKIKRVMKKNQLVEKIGSKKEWIKIKYDSKEGWTHKALLIEK